MQEVLGSEAECVVCWLAVTTNDSFHNLAPGVKPLTVNAMWQS